MILQVQLWAPRSLGVLCVALLLLATVLSVDPLKAAELEPLVIETSNGDFHFEVEYAGTDTSRARGLMFRDHMDPDHGMIFDFEKPRRVSMWMRNTLISLDMLFTDENGVIHYIAHETTPLSERSIGPAELTLAVLEINGGIAKQQGIKVGDRVRHRMFD